MKLQAGIYDQSTERLLLDFTHRFADGQMSNGSHGSQELSGVITGRLNRVFWLFADGLKGHKVEINYGAMTVWAGRIEVSEIVAGGIRIVAMGLWRAFSDVLYTALWSTKKISEFRQMTPVDFSTRDPARFHMDKSERLHVSNRKNESYGAGADHGGWTYETPDGSTRNITHIYYTLDFKATSDFDFRILRWTRAFGSPATDYALTGNGSSQSGASPEVLSASTPRIEIALYYNSANDFTAESGVNYYTITDLRITTQAAPIDSSDVASALLTYVRAVNSQFLSADTSQIEDASLDITELAPQDARPADILQYLADLGDSSGNAWEVGVDNKTLYLRQMGSRGNTWYADLADIRARRDLADMFNEGYGLSSDISNKDRRSSSQTEDAAKTREGVIRHAFTDTGTTNATDAADQAAALISDLQNPTPRAAFEIAQLFAHAGSTRPVPGFLVKAHDTIVIRNLPPVLSAAVPDSFLVGEVTIDITSGRGIPVIKPILGLPNLADILAGSHINQDRTKPVEAPKPGVRPPGVKSERA